MSKDGDDFEKFMILEMQNEIKNITKDAEVLLRKNVQSELYDNYTPTSYTRTNELKNAITSKMDVDGSGFTYFDESKLNHKSVVTGENVGKFVPKWTDMGHEDGKGDSAFHKYEGRNFIDKTILELELKYGKDCVVKVDNT